MEFHRWLEKDCACSMAMARTGTTRYRFEEGREYVVITATYYPGPSCDVCGKPWAEKK